MQATLAKEGYQVGLIPAGHTIAAVSQAMLDGQTIGGLTTANDLYRDQIHANNAERYLASLAAYTAVFGLDPTGRTVGNFPGADYRPFSLPGYGTTLDPSGVFAVQQFAWQTHRALSVPEPTGAMLLVLCACVGNLVARRRT